MADPRALPDQIAHILSSHDDAAVANPDWEADGNYGYIYRRGHVLTRDGDSVSVGRELTNYLRSYSSRNEQGWVRAGQADAQQPDPSVRLAREVPGAHLMEFSTGLDPAASTEPGIPELLDELDAALGAGIVRPDHVLTASSHACPATEPEELPEDAPPLPPVMGEPCLCGQCTGAGVRISIIDTGLVPGAAHDSPWLAGVGGDVDPYEVGGEILEYTGHGTFSAGCLRTIARGAEIYVERGVVHGGSAYESELAAQLAQGLARNPDIVVFCFAADTRNELSLLGIDAILDAYEPPAKGMILLAPAGNEGNDLRKYPAASKSFVGVGALSADWSERASFSSYGDWVDVFTPGEDLLNAFARGTYYCHWDPDKGQERHFAGHAQWSGTSFSTPIMAGLIAARMSATGEDAPTAGRTLLRQARRQIQPAIGPVLLPGQTCPARLAGRGSGTLVH